MDNKPLGSEDAQRVTQEAQKSSQKVREILEKNHDPYKASAEVMKSVDRSGQGQVVKTEEQPIEETALDPQDYYERPDDSKARKEAGVGGSKPKDVNGERSRFQRFQEHAKDSIARAKAISERVAQRVGERYPQAREIPKLVNEFVRSENGKDIRSFASAFLKDEVADQLKKEAAELAAKAAIKQGVGSVVPGGEM